MFERAIALDPGLIDAYYYWVRSGKVPIEHDFLAALEAMAPRAGTLSRDDLATLHFALGNAYEDVGRYDDAFASLLTANRAARSSMDYDETRAREFFARIRAIFTARLMAEKVDFGSPSTLPIFIVGFPRSGTTLTEQILASHPKVHGAGEVGFLAELTAEAVVSDGGKIAFPESLPRLGAESLRRLGESYVARLGRTDPAAAHVTDKNLGNFGFLGFINLILPRAKIIHVQRDPFDTCLSCFSLRFAGNGSGFIYDLGELGRHYRMYQDMMDHWRQTLSPGAMLEVQYESIVEDLEAEARRMVAYCGLAWDERCLAFHQNERSVRTASATQVRRRIYRSSVQRWRRYEKHLGPLMDALGLSLTEVPRP
jgi:tetratricopeptide (TPR) repeat protein